MSSNPLIDCYHELLLTEYKKIKECMSVLDDSRSRLNSEEVRKIVSTYGINEKQLMSQGLLIEYPDSTFRTMHMDLIFRAVNVKAAPWSPKIALEFKIPEPRIEYLPSFDEVQLEELKTFNQLSSNLSEVLCKSLQESGHKGLAFHQYYYLQKILAEQQKCYMLVAPTASGKSLIFYLAILINVLSRLNQEGTKTMILYPRKALATDQLSKFLKLVHKINYYLSSKGLRKITIGLDDGDTPRSFRSDVVKSSEIFRGIKCMKPGCQGSLRYQVIDEKSLIVCEACKEVYDEIFTTKEDIWSGCPDIVFSNLSALNRRMMMKSAQGLMGPSLKWIVLDEAHVYREELGGHVRWLLRRLDARFNVLTKGNIRFIISSATIPKPVLFASKLVGLEAERIYFEQYNEILKLAKRKFRKITLDVILAPNPLRSAETLVEELALLLGVWCFTNLKKAVIFVDNVSEIERLHDFVVNTIICERKAHNDHLDPAKTQGVMNITNTFSWRSITRNVSNIDPLSLAGIYNVHNAELPPQQRAMIENLFKSKNSGLIFSTSTLELGIDIGDVAAIVQYKVPLTSESYIQRVGRAGRSDDILKVALGMLVLTNSPSQVRFILGNEYLRLIDPEQIDPYIEIPVAWENEEIKRQHVIFSILDTVAAKGSPTYLDYTTEIRNYWSGVQDVINSLQELLVKARNELNVLKDYVTQVADDVTAKSIESIVDRIENMIRVSSAQLSEVDVRNINENLERLRKAETAITEAVRNLHNIRRYVQEFLPTLQLQELIDYKERLLEVEESLRKVLNSLEKLRR